jgi:predicted  nucleic acid-binding Zn-ribbon protein
MSNIANLNRRIAELSQLLAKEQDEDERERLQLEIEDLEDEIEEMSSERDHGRDSDWR